MEQDPGLESELKPFRSKGLVRRVTPFMGAGLVALVVFVDPDFAHLQVAEGLALVLAAAVILAVILPIDWDRLPRLTITVPLVAALLLAWGGVLAPGSPSFLAASAAGAVIIVGIYVLPWDRLPRWVHNLPIFGAIGAVFIFQAIVRTPSLDATALLLFPLMLTTVLFAALYHTRNELLAAAGLASIGIIIAALLKTKQTGGLATAVLVIVVLWVVVLTVNEVVRQSRKAASEAERMSAALERDVTARKQAEASVTQLNSELQSANQHKSEFLANMSHELRTPLNAILGFSDLLIDDTTNKRFDSATRKRFLGQINSSGRHLLALINDVLDLSKVEAGQMILRIEDVSVVNVVRDVMSTIDPLATKKSIRLEAEVDSAGEVQADAAKLKQMLLNLVNNAVKFTPEGGRVTITARRLKDSIEISVADTGIGIAAADQKQLFTEFHQLDSTASRQQEGTGLGLALTKRFVELHGGQISVVSELGAGSVFKLTLPLTQIGSEVPAAVPPLPGIAAPNDTRPLVLIVEDNLQAAHLLSRYLDRGGFRSVVAVDGKEAVAKAGELHPVAITLDILLPGIDGWSVLTELKHLEATRDIPVVVISVVDDPELGRALGAIDYLVKPVDGKALLERLAKYTFTSSVTTQETHILVVDDEPANIEWLEGVLKPAGFSVTSARGGKEGIRVAKSRHPDLVLLDLMMPKVSGFDVVQALQADASTRSIPIMVLTAKDLTADDKRQLNGHVTAILSRGATGAPDLLGWLDRLVSAQAPVRLGIPRV